jgi:hypothetical protein
LALVDNSKVLESFRKRRERFTQDMTKAMQTSGHEFIAYIQQKEYSGRPGLNVQTGALRSGWREKTKGTGLDIVTTVTPGPTSKKYARIHDKSREGDGIIRPKTKQYLWFKVQSGTRTTSKRGKPLKKAVTEFSWVRTKQVFIPIRTDVVGDFTGKGRNIFLSNINAALKRWAHAGT